MSLFLTGVVWDPKNDCLTIVAVVAPIKTVINRMRQENNLKLEPISPITFLILSPPNCYKNNILYIWSESFLWTKNHMALISCENIIMDILLRPKNNKVQSRKKQHEKCTGNSNTHKFLLYYSSSKGTIQTPACYYWWKRCRFWQSYPFAKGKCVYLNGTATRWTKPSIHNASKNNNKGIIFFFLGK